MNRIRLLPEHVANQIAAGEVVERPASVVKELVENSLDAGSTQLTVEIQAGGRSLIRVTDDGSGMSRDDALLSLERHATSKIKKAEDLYAISTMGFRGEAIPSIASVSRMSITTRERDGSEEGTQIIIHGGKILEVRAAGCASGTIMEVRQLFFNLPARRKFLRSEETERAHIQHYLTLVALAHPHVAITFIQDGRIAWQLPAVTASGAQQAQSVHERFRALYGADFEMLPVDFSAEFDAPPEPDGDLDVVPRKEAFRLWGLIGAPGISRGTREDQHLFVNKRPVENRGLNHALFEGYHTMLMKGRYPICCLFLEISPAAVDVNIHPSKREVKFHRERDVRHLVTQAVRGTLLKYHQKTVSIPAAPELPTISPPEKTLFDPSQDVASAKDTESARASVSPPAQPPPLEPRTFPNFIPPLPQAPVQNWPNRPVRTEPPPSNNGTPATPLAPVVESPTPQRPMPAPGPVPLLEVPLRLLGVVGKLYVVLESDRGLVLLDQHAAHERILFEQMLQRMEQGPAASQRLLLPHTIEVSPKDAQFLRDQLETLTRLGVGLSEFGERTFLLDSLPPFVKAPDAKKFVLELIDALKAAGQEVNTWRLGEEMIAKTVCRHAVKANDPLTTPELENLVNDLRRCSMPYTCPHGRPTLIEMNFRELEKKFGRIQ